MLEKWKRSVDNGKAFGALLTDLSKAFDCLDHKLLIAKLNAYGFSLTALKLIHDYLSNRKQRNKINSSDSSWHEIIFEVPQGSILGPLLFNIFLIDLFFIVKNTDIASYADDNTPYISANNINEVIISLEKATNTSFKWFSDNVMKSNAEKFHLLVSTNNAINIKIGNIDINNSTCEKLLGVKSDYKLTFEDHISELRKKVSKKIHALARVTPYMNIAKKRILMNAFFKSQFSYCPLVWMCIAVVTKGGESIIRRHTLKSLGCKIGNLNVNEIIHKIIPNSKDRCLENKVYTVDGFKIQLVLTETNVQHLDYLHFYSTKNKNIQRNFE